MSYNATRSRVADMIADKGQTVTIAGASSSTYDPATGGVTTIAYSATAKAVVIPLSPFKIRSDSGIAQGDEGLLLAGLDTSGATVSQPPLGSTITLANGDKYTLIACEPLHPDGLDILYDCAIRGNG